MNLDDEIYKEIGQLLYNSAPGDAKLVIMEAELSPEGDSCHFNYDYINEKNEKNWFLPEDGVTDQRLRELLVLLRRFFIENFKSKEKPFWHGCIAKLDIPKSEITIDFKYN
ncbi:hypothetical protein ACM94E_000984 [Enterobacter cloacae]|uniref:hypothetical protein n=1 Tax=Enterobacter cloacae TaxID=550 RepID=UPI0011E7907C|nr:hypothetical protein [Enterobacter cloacae]ELK7549428.1 hypothetical protein [Enterobacter cloacae]ELV2766839.1 hypothetical protein [Enterobacter cloacae]ELV2780150.1 hypothetical protein [Enterobacter cloacae]MCK7173303.1 hypothetical protein [Enterobacter cloacae]TYR21600.1 hypothetical protein FYC79_20970 [Enterobacter cloacae]